MEIPYTVKPRPDTGLYNGKLGIWLFLASEVMLFGALFSSYVLLRVGAEAGTWSMGLMNVTVGAGNTMVLIASSMFVVLAWAQLKQGNLSGKWISKPFFKSTRNWGYVQWKWATIACAVLFLVVKWSYEWPEKFKHYDVWLNDKTVLNQHFENGYNAIASASEEVKSVQEHVEGIYTERFFKEASDGPDGSKAAFSKAWDNGTLALSGHINAYEEALIDVEIGAWNADAGVTQEKAKAAIKAAGASPEKAFEGSDQVLPKLDYKQAKEAEYALGQAGFEVKLSVVEYKSVTAHPWVWRTKRINEDIGGKPRVRSITLGLDHSYDKKIPKQEVAIETRHISRLSSFEPKHSTFFGIYYTITGLHAAHVFGGIIVMLYNMLPIGLAVWHKDREQFTNRIETFGLFWHFVDLVWIFLFPILYIL
tara:strand:- start:2939 stop:4201 length:1263 start_codon:yes stop_codon:yes gene_type:complete